MLQRAKLARSKPETKSMPGAPFSARRWRHSSNGDDPTTEHEKHLLEIGAVAVGALAIVLFLKHQPAVSTVGGAVPLSDLGVTDQGDNPGTDYLTYNYPPSLVQQPLPGVPA